MLTQRVELGCVGEYRNDGARDVIISTCKPPLSSGCAPEEVVHVQIITSRAKGMVEPSVEPSESKKTVQLKQPSKSKNMVRGRKRRRGDNHPATRKSARLQKKARREDGEEEEEGSRRREEEGSRKRKEEMERVRGEQRALCGRVVQFVSSVEDKTSFTHHPISQVYSHT